MTLTTTGAGSILSAVSSDGITWTSYNMPAAITQGTRTVSFQHDTEHQRIKQVAPDGTTLYIHAFGVTAELFGVGSAAPWEYAEWAATPTGGWLAQHAADFGFVMSYPPGRSAVTCYDYEPWHYRWVGRPVATAVIGTGRTLREFQTGIR